MPSTKDRGTLMELTKDADKLVCQLYRAYLEKRKSGINKFNAKHFTFSQIKELQPFSKWADMDVKETVAEVSRAGFGTMYYDGGFMANDQFIIYMENRFKNGLSEVIDFISKLIP